MTDQNEEGSRAVAGVAAATTERAWIDAATGGSAPHPVMDQRVLRMWVDRLRGGGSRQVSTLLHTEAGFSVMGVLVNLYRTEMKLDWEPCTCKVTDLPCMALFGHHVTAPSAVLRWAGLDRVSGPDRLQWLGSAWSDKLASLSCQGLSLADLAWLNDVGLIFPQLADLIVAFWSLSERHVAYIAGASRRKGGPSDHRQVSGLWAEIDALFANAHPANAHLLKVARRYGYYDRNSDAECKLLLDDDSCNGNPLPEPAHGAADRGPR